MLAYTKGISKKQFVKEMELHKKADDFIKGTYSEGQKGCSVGCALKSVMTLKKIEIRTDDHKQFENHLGIPEWLARVNDTIFEGVLEKRSKIWPIQFAKAINEGSDLEKVKTPFLIYILEQNLITLDSLKVSAQFKDVIKAIALTKTATQEMIIAQKSGKGIDAAESAAWSAESAARSARSAESAAWSAESAAWSAESAAESAARSARSAESAAWSAESAAWSAAWSAESAAWSARSARSAESAAWSAESAAWSAESAAWSASFEKHADKLLDLMKNCK